MDNNTTTLEHKVNTQAPVFGVEDFKKFMETEEGRKVLNPMFDKKVSTAIETWKSNNIEKVVNEELVKRGYVKTEEQKKMIELEQQIANIQKEKELAEKKAVALAELNANGLNTALADFISYDSEETIRTGVSTFKSILDDLVEKEVKKRTAGTGAKPQDVKNTAPKLTVKDVMKMSYKERNQLAQENPELFKQLMGV
jgi:hypothetical protein|nr:MAG TPA: protein of unknown function (DUF4355) [Caudoviricetes sp.]